jgi:nucleotide-binding universal stress UspA family protein
MIKTILVPASGSDSDQAVFGTALAAARLFDAHLDFCHIRIDPAEALRHMPHGGFAMGTALRVALDSWSEEGDTRAAGAVQHIRDFCVREQIEIAEAPSRVDTVSASWCEHAGPAEEHLLARARHSDLVVMGRPHGPNGMPPDLLRLLLLESGRPVLVAPPQARERLAGTVMVCWKEAREPARAVTAAMPFLTKADRVVVVAVEEGGMSCGGALADLRSRLARHGVRAEPRAIRDTRHPAATLLAEAAKECGADLLVMGGYGHTPLREDLFGGCTRSFLDHAEVPIFLLH